MEIVGYICAMLVGVSLGMLGAGGSILTIPILIYFFHIDPLHATTYSFFIVGFTAFFGAAKNVRNGTVQLMPAVYFAVTGGIVIFLVRNYLLDAIPEILFSFQDVSITKDLFILLFFSVIMIVSGISMIMQASKNIASENSLHDVSILKLILLGFLVGFVIAFAGVGGGFLITPALIVFAGLNVKKAIGTSLCIISLNSFTGFFSSLHLHEDMNWNLLFLFVLLAAVGVFIGMYLSKGIENRKMKKIFGGFILAVGIFILLKELILEM